MRRTTGQLGTAVALIALIATAGCQKPSGPSDSGGGKQAAGKGMAEQYRAGMAEQKAQAIAEAKKNPPEAPPAPKMPEVKLPAALAETCLVKVNDAIPDAELPGLDGKRASVRSLLGKSLSVVLFWQSDSVYATQALEYLQLDVAKPFADRGVQVIGISVKDKLDVARKAVEEANAKYANLLDADGKYFAKVATDRIPRVYLVDAAGKILWFDIEYSTSTRRDLERAIHFVLDGK